MKNPAKAGFFVSAFYSRADRYWRTSRRLSGCTVSLLR